MKKILPKVDVPLIREWGEQYHKDVIDTDSIWQVCEWCRLYAKNSPVKDTKNVLCRLNIGIYQLAYVRPLIMSPIAPAEEWSEIIASCMIHFLGSLENIGIDCAVGLSNNACHVSTFSKLSLQLAFVGSREEIHYRLLNAIPTIIQQVYYFEMGRSSRFNKEKLSMCGVYFIRDLIVLNEIGREYLPIEQGLALAMGKLSDVELNGH